MGWRIASGMALALACSRAPAWGGGANWIWFNSHALVVERGRGSEELASLARPEIMPGGGLDLLDGLGARGLGVEELLAQPRLVAGLVLACLPERTCVLPTEQYFYFEMSYRGAPIAGNLRFTDIERGVLHCGYYRRDDQSVGGHASLGSADGVCVSSWREGRVRVARIEDERTGRACEFSLPSPWCHEFASEYAAVPGEEYLSPVLDESGFGLHLVFDHDAKRFAYLLGASPPGESAGVGSGGLVVFEPSGFAFARDGRGRLFLWGVRADQVRLNTFHDGPFDQVPPDLSLRALLLEVYPGLDAAPGGPIDLHGNWTGREGVRVAISPYRDYEPGMLDVPEVGLPAAWASLAPGWEGQARGIKARARRWPWGHGLDDSRCWGE